MPASSSLMPPSRAAKTVFLVAGAAFGFLLAVMVALIAFKGESYSQPSGLRMPSGPTETRYAERMASEGHEVAFYEGGKVSVLVKEAEWQAMAKDDRFARHRFLSDSKAKFVALQQERGEKAVYTMSIKSAETHRLLAEETDFNPKFYD
ncbi:hypothetical protein J7643_01860 [bacterium]|nr:hypothetical protein [bacterium]